MTNASKIGEDFKQKLALTYSPIGFYFAEQKPAGAMSFKQAGERADGPPAKRAGSNDK